MLIALLQLAIGYTCANQASLLQKISGMGHQEKTVASVALQVALVKQQEPNLFLSLHPPV